MNRTPSDLALAQAALASAHMQGVGRTLKIARLEKAVRHFNTSLQAVGPIPARRKEVLTGLFESQCELVTVLSQNEWTEAVVASFKHAFTEMLSTADALLVNPFSSGIQEKTVSAFETLAEKTARLSSPEQRIGFFRWLHARICGMNQRQRLLPTRLLLFGHLALEVYHQALHDFEAGRWAKALSALRAQGAELESCVELEARLVGDRHTESTNEVGDWALRGLKADIELLVLSCEGSQLLHNGDQSFSRAMNCDPEDALGWAQVAQDDYREALSRVTERDIELEGMTLFRLARFHSKITKLPAHAHMLYLRAVQLAAALAPALPKGSWYLDCTKAVQDHRDELEKKEAAAWHNRRIPILAELEPELQKIAANQALGNLEFAKWIWNEWPPRTGGSQELPPGGEDGPGIRKLYLKVVQRYHPDRNSMHGDKWQVLAEEIAKALNARYQRMKGV